MTLDGLRQQLKAKKLPTSGNKKTLAARLSAHFDRSSTSNRAKRTEGNPRQREAGQRERRTQQTDHNRQISPSLELRTTSHKKPRRRRSTATARQREQDSDSGEPSRRRRRPQTISRQRGSPSESSRSRSRSPISTRRPNEGSKGRQRDPWRSSPHSHHTRTRHTNSPTSSSDAEASDDLPYTLGLYQSSSLDSVLSEKDLPAAPSTTLGEDTDLASADLLRDVRGDTTSTRDPPAAARVHRRAPRGSLIRGSAQIQA